MEFHHASPAWQIDAAGQRLHSLGLQPGLQLEEPLRDHGVIKEIEAICGHPVPDGYRELVCTYTNGFSVSYCYGGHDIHYAFMSAEESLRELLADRAIREELGPYVPKNRKLYEDCLDRHRRSFAIMEDGAGDSVRVDTKLESIVYHDHECPDYFGSHLEVSFEALMTKHAGACFWSKSGDFILRYGWQCPQELRFKQRSRTGPGDYV